VEARRRQLKSWGGSFRGLGPKKGMGIGMRLVVEVRCGIRYDYRDPGRSTSREPSYVLSTIDRGRQRAEWGHRWMRSSVSVSAFGRYVGRVRRQVTWWRMADSWIDRVGSGAE
jgi:hypothetical protein